MLEVIAWVSLGVAMLCAVAIVADEVRRPQAMTVMNFVWPLTAMYLSVFGVWLYFRYGTRMAKGAVPMATGGEQKKGVEQKHEAPSASQALTAATHCGAGCTLGDVIAEFSIFGLGVTLAGSALWAGFVWDFVAAWLLGIVFQYFTIVPMRKLSPGTGLVAAMKADTLSILAFQVGMYGWMALVWFRLFPSPHLHPNEAAYWLMMQVGMACGLVTAWPMNWWLVRAGLKEAMG